MDTVIPRDENLETLEEESEEEDESDEEHSITSDHYYESSEKISAIDFLSGGEDHCTELFFNQQFSNYDPFSRIWETTNNDLLADATTDMENTENILDNGPEEFDKELLPIFSEYFNQMENSES